MVWLNNLGFADPYGTTSRAVDALFTQGARDLGNGFLVVRVGDDALLEATIDCLTRGECGTTSTAPDPLLDWVYAPRTEGEVYGPLAAPPSEHRLGWFKWLMAYSAYFALARNGLYALVHAAEPRKVLAAAVTGPPGTIPYGKMSGGEMGDWCQKAGMAMAIEVLANGEKALRNRVLGTWQGQAHGAAHSRHLEVVIVAAAPECQGRGVGSALLAFLGQLADADGVATHLETAGARNAGFYARKGGYREVHRSAVASFSHQGGGVAMQRPPGSAGGQAPRPSGAAAPPVARCRGFRPKRPNGPLAAYCVHCGEHSGKCAAAAH